MSNGISAQHAEMIKVFGCFIHNEEIWGNSPLILDLVYGMPGKRRNLYKNWNYDPWNLDPVLDWPIEDFL